MGRAAARFAIEVRILSLLKPLAVTAHNLAPHNEPLHGASARAYGAALRAARKVFVHSQSAGEVIFQMHRVNAKRVVIVPHGDLSAHVGPLPCRQSARLELGIPEKPLCAIFGSVEPYKGIEEVIEAWGKLRPRAILLIAGKPLNHAYGERIETLAHNAGCKTQIGWLPDERLRSILAATNCALFNYKSILTSGAACLARSLGIPILLPARLKTIDLAEPCSRVIRFNGFDEDFLSKLELCLHFERDWESAAAWREACSWDKVAAITARAYREAIESCAA
jgi:glycosyltransferase involved in cell wall biosynthesis